MPHDHTATRAHTRALTVVLAVAAGGAAGACLRATVGQLAPVTDGFPWTTFWVNVGGSALLALLPASVAVRSRPWLLAMLGTGVLGGFTTLSAWSQETHDLVAAGRVALALAYAVGTLLACLVAIVLVERLSARGERAGADETLGSAR